MRIVLFGAGGQVGRELSEIAWPKGLALLPFERQTVDITDVAAVWRVISRSRAALAINMAAYTAVDHAETEPQKARMINALGARNVAAACRRANAALVHVSSDYVFSGEKPDAYCEADAVSPINVYGQTKAEGETLIRNELEQHIILRTSWIFGARGQNFVKSMLRLGADRPVLPVVSDQRGCPTAAADIAAAVVAICRRIAGGDHPWGTYHFAGAPATTWDEFATAIFELSAARGGPRSRVEPISTAEYPTLARRPANSALDCSRIASRLGIEAPQWRAGLDAMLSQLLAGPVRQLVAS